MTTPEDILHFWFGHVPHRRLSARDALKLTSRLPMWAGKWGGLVWDVDTRIRERFATDLERAGAGHYDAWAATPRGRLALIVLLDQFARNIHRSTPHAYAHDSRSLQLTLEAIDQREDFQFYPVVRSFYYLPLVHQEDLACQERAVAAYASALPEASLFQRTILLAEYTSALRHRQIIRRFGRYPHRNRVLGRASTPEELRFLRQPFSQF